MSPGEPSAQEVAVPTDPFKCRIPQRLPVARLKPMSCKGKTNSDQMAGRWSSPPVQQQQRTSTRATSSSLSGFSESRPRSANRVKDGPIVNPPHTVSRRPADRERFQLKRPSMLRKNIKAEISKKTGKGVITVPLDSQQKQNNQHNLYNKRSAAYSSQLPDQETIRNLELQNSPGNPSPFSGDSGSPERKTHSEVSIMLANWNQHTAQYEQMKNDLADRQKAVVKLYVDLQNKHHKMVLMGEKVTLPSSEDLSIMNVAKLTPDQLLRLCTVHSGHELMDKNTSLLVDVRKLYDLPTKIIATCEQTLIKRMEIIEWFTNLKSSEKGIPIHTLDKKINEFTAENEMLRCSFQQAKLEFLRELNDMIDFLRKTVNETVALQLRTEEQTYEMSELSSLNSDLRKRIHQAETMKPNKGKIEELEKELKEERSRKSVMKERLARAEGQMKIEMERASQLEAVLEQSRAKNQKLQSDFDKELNTLTASIRENTCHLEEIGIAREKLQSEKKDLEKRLEQLSQSYNESLLSVKAEMEANLTKLMATEKKYQEEIEKNKDLVTKLDAVTAQANKYVKLNEDLLIELKEYKEKLLNSEEELQFTKHNLELLLNDLQEHKTRAAEQNETVKLLEHDLVESYNLEEKLKSSIKNKDEYIAELERKQGQQAKQLQESEEKMCSYEQQLTSLKSHITQLKEDFGEFENLDELHDLVNEQREKLMEATKQNEDLSQLLQKKDSELQEQLANLENLDKLVAEKDNEIKKLSEKDEEQSNIIKLLRNNLEIRSRADEDLSQQITEKQSEVSKLEKIILVLEEEARKSSSQRKNDQERINLMEKQIAVYEASFAEHKREVPPYNLDRIIKILEEELGMSVDPNLSPRSHKSKKKYMRDLPRHESHTGDSQIMYPPEHESVSAKIVMGNFVKKTFISGSNEELKRDLGRREVITNINPQKAVPNSCNIRYVTPVNDKEYYREPQYANTRHKDYPEHLFAFRTLPYINNSHIRDEKKSKMFKFAVHRL